MVAYTPIVQKKPLQNTTGGTTAVGVGGGVTKLGTPLHSTPNPIPRPGAGAAAPAGGGGGGGGGVSAGGYGSMNSGTAGTPGTPASPTNLPAMPATPPLTNTAQQLPELQKQQQEYEEEAGNLKNLATQNDPLLEEQVQNLRNRLSADTTKRSTDQAAGATRDFMAGLGEQAGEQGAKTGQGQGAQAGEIAQAGTRAMSKASADIVNARNQAMDQLVLGGQGIMGAPGQQKMQANQLLADFVKANPAATSAQIALQAQKLGLDQWALPQQIAIQYLQTQNQMLNPLLGLLSGNVFA